jgi:hypothetical protein
MPLWLDYRLEMRESANLRATSSAAPGGNRLESTLSSLIGDGSIGMEYNVSIPPGGTRTVTMTYKPI